MSSNSRPPSIPVLRGVHGTGETYWTGTGQLLVDVHRFDPLCGFGCVIHNVTAHKMAHLPTHWTQDELPGQMVRVCEDGIHHPDPDDLAYHAKAFGVVSASYRFNHDCDGCCDGAYERFMKIVQA
jgi:hypothetical protein